MSCLIKNEATFFCIMQNTDGKELVNKEGIYTSYVEIAKSIKIKKRRHNCCE